MTVPCTHENPKYFWTHISSLHGANSNNSVSPKNELLLTIRLNWGLFTTLLIVWRLVQLFLVILRGDGQSFKIIKMEYTRIFLDFDVWWKCYSFAKLFKLLFVFTGAYYFIQATSGLTAMPSCIMHNLNGVVYILFDSSMWDNLRQPPPSVFTACDLC